VFLQNAWVFSHCFKSLVELVSAEAFIISELFLLRHSLGWSLPHHHWNRCYCITRVGRTRKYFSR